METITQVTELICENGFSLPSTEETQRVLDNLFPARAIRKVLLVNPPDVDAPMFRRETAKRGRYANYPPYGLAILAQQLRTIQVAVHILNLNHEVLARSVEDPVEEEFAFDSIWQKNLEAKIEEWKPDLIGVTCMFTMTHVSLRNVCGFASKFGIPICVGGVHVSNDIERILNDIPQVQVAFLKEADVAFKTFVQVVNKSLSVEDLGQLVINDQGKSYRYSQDHQPNSEDISIIPAYDLLDISGNSQYGTIGSFFHIPDEGTRFATIISNRGCRAACTFCSVPAFNGRRVRQRTIHSVLDELELLQNEYGIGHVMWLDDDLFKDERRTVDLFNQMVQRNLKLTWDASNGVIAASCTEEVIAAAAASGCIGLHIGMESGNREVLRQIKKPGTVETFLKAAEVLRKHQQIVSSVFVMIGFPGETFTMIGDTLKVASQMDLDWYSVGQLQPLPNTPIYDCDGCRRLDSRSWKLGRSLYDWLSRQSIRIRRTCSVFQVHCRLFDVAQTCHSHGERAY